MSQVPFIEFTQEMRKDYTILVPSMLPIHFELMAAVFEKHGYHCEMLKNENANVVAQGVANVHNDTCYPALLVVGQFMDALANGKYDPHKCALLLMQTGGGCRASNYVRLLRKALSESEFNDVPVISINFTGLETHSGFKLTLPFLLDVLQSFLYGDFLMWIYNQARSREIHEGDSKKALDYCMDYLLRLLNTKGFKQSKKRYREILTVFNQIQLDENERIKVGIVGEIYMKYAPLGNQHLEDTLVKEGVEPVVSGVLDFAQYCLYNMQIDQKLYGSKVFGSFGSKILTRLLANKQAEMEDVIGKYSRFRKPTPFKEVIRSGEGIISKGVKMGEGWLLTSEICELMNQGIYNVVCAQPFGCLPNHIVAKGMMRKIKEKYPQSNIVAIDYDSSASPINQMNRIHLMLENAKMGNFMNEK